MGKEGLTQKEQTMGTKDFKNIVLIGTIAAGKTTVGKAIAEMSDYKFVDTDELARNSINAAELGFWGLLLEFGGAEEAAIDDVSEREGYVIATGAMAASKPGAIEKLRRKGVIVRLMPDVQTVIKRITESGRTFLRLKDERVEESIKRDYYEHMREYADYDYSIAVSDEETPEQLAAKILQMLA